MSHNRSNDKGKPITNQSHNESDFIRPNALQIQRNANNSIQKQDEGNASVKTGEDAKNASVSSSVQKYTHPDKAKYKSAKERAQSNYDKTYKEYKDYYLKIGKINTNSTEADIWRAFSEPNKVELNRLKESVSKNVDLYAQAQSDEKQWNKLDSELASVANSFSNQKGLKGSQKMNPNLLKALMFSESEMGAGIDYKKLVAGVPKSNPKAVYQLNLGRVTDGNVYNSVVKEFNIPVNWQTNYLAMGNKNDVMLAAGALIQKYEYAKKFGSSPHLKAGQHWFNAIVAYKGISAEGKRKAQRVWNLYTTGTHPYSTSKKLF